MAEHPTLASLLSSKKTNAVSQIATSRDPRDPRKHLQSQRKEELKPSGQTALMELLKQIDAGKQKGRLCNYNIALS